MIWGYHYFWKHPFVCSVFSFGWLTLWVIFRNITRDLNLAGQTPPSSGQWKECCIILILFDLNIFSIGSWSAWAWKILSWKFQGLRFFGTVPENHWRWNNIQLANQIDGAPTPWPMSFNLPREAPSLPIAVVINSAGRWKQPRLKAE